MSWSSWGQRPQPSTQASAGRAGPAGNGGAADGQPPNQVEQHAVGKLTRPTASPGAVCQAPVVGLAAEVGLALLNQGGGDDRVVRLHGALLVSPFTSTCTARPSNCQCCTS